MEEITLYKGLFDLVLWMVIFILLQPAVKTPYKLKRINIITGLALILLFCLFPFWGGDYYHSRDSFEFIKAGGYNHFEMIYGWIITELCSSYFYFRLVVWGSALSILFYAYKRTGINFNMSLFFFGALFLVRFSYARASLAMAIILLGMTFIYKPLKGKKILSIIIGLALLASAELFHRSAIIGIATVIATLFLINNKRWKMVLLVILLPMAGFAMSYILGGLLEVDLDVIDESMSNKLTGYLSRDFEEKGLASKISNFLLVSPMFLSAFTCVAIVIKKEIEYFSIVERGFAYYVFIIMLLALGFALSEGFGILTLYYRTIYFAMPATAVFLTSLKSRKLEKKLVNYIYYLGASYCAFALLYATYMGYNRM